MPRTSFTLVNKTKLIEKVYLLTFKTEDELEFIPGHFFSMQVAPQVNRSYSTCYFSKKAPNFTPELESFPTLGNGFYVSFMISTKPGGEASRFFDNISEGQVISAIGPSGRFHLEESSNPKVFIATGTGLAPFVPMIKQAFEQNPDTKIKLFFGCYVLEDNFVNKFFEEYSKNDNLEVYSVVENLDSVSTSENILSGRVTTAIPEIVTDYQNTDFYLCGHPMMVSAMEEVLKEKGASENIYMEKFGVVVKK